MKKLFTILTMLALTITGVQAQNHHVPYTGQNFLNESTLKSRVADAADGYLVALQIHAGSTFYINNQGKAQTSFSSTGETTWIVEKTSDDKYLLKTYGGNYIKSLGNNNSTAATFTTNSNEALKFNPVQSTSTDGNMESGYVANKAIWWNVDGGSNRINTNGISGTNKTIFQNNGTGCWTCLFTYEVKKYKVTFNCKKGETLIYTESTFANTGDVLNVPDLPGYTASPSNVTVGNEDTSVDISYTPDRYPVNFPSGQTFTRSDRHINSVTFDIEGEDQTVNELYNNTSTKCYQDLTDSKTVTLPVNTSVQPKFSVTGAWQHGFVYIDLNKDGDFTDDGELVSKINSGNPNLSTDMPSFPTPSEPGEYRMRIKTDWASEDPGGNTGADPHTISSSNHIIANGGMIVDVNLVISAYEVTYQVQDENEHVLYTSSAVPTTLGTKITTLPAQYQKADFYDYNTLDITISDLETTAVFTATKKDAPLVKYTADTTDPDWYKMKLKNANYPTYVADGTPNVTTPTTNADDETVQWAFIGEPYAGFHIICRAAIDGDGNYLVLGSGTTTGSADNGGSVHATFAAEDSQNNELWDIRPSTFLAGGFFLFNGEGHALNERNTANLAYWTAGYDMGSTFTVTEVLKGEALFNALIEELETYPYGTGLNKYHVYDESSAHTYYGEVISIINGLKKAGYSESNLATAQALKDGTSINQPTTGFYRFKSNATGKYIGYAGSGSQPMVEEANAGIYYYTEGKRFLNYNQGRYLGGATGNAITAVGTEGPAFNFYETGYSTPTLGTYRIRVSDGSYGSLIDWTDNYLNGWGDGDNARCEWIIEPVTSLPFEIEANSYKSFSAPVAITIPGNCKAYIAKTKNNNTIKMEEVTGNVPANTGLVIGSGEATNLSFDIYTGNDLTVCSGDLLECNIAAAELSRNDNYFFGKQKSTGNYIFTKLSGTGDNYTLYGFKSYLPAANLPDAVDARIAVVWDYDDPTGLNELKDDSMEVKDGKYYQNQKIVVIRNGVKYNVAGQIIK